ncbi:tegument protein UL7 [Aotine betaherpesvirus 1]|uniref:Tegument protein UL7 n=1 Tax=Aotine betaherpesvirus 1 TaxID=50290 RepID=G8XUG7_9BETA|nr:tegument protein UL7 [Aotine betaherpesvirus 1]AEV80797.1 tegument protein UL7 [Aotine betaherpesvirus 1]
MEALMIRGVLEVHCEDNVTVFCMQPEVMDITHQNNKLWVHTDHGTVVSMNEYHAECKCRSSWLGYSAVFLLENEDALSRVKLSAIRLKHRTAVLVPSTLKQFSLCVILSCVENVPLTRRCLQELLAYVQGLQATDRIDSMLQSSCRRLICSALYLFFDHPAEEIKPYVPKIFVLYMETRTSYVETIARLFLRLASLKDDEKTTLCLLNRLTLDEVPVSTALHDVLNESYPHFYKHFMDSPSLPIQGPYYYV